ncbi:MAG TPA: TonB family protein [Bryobacteraceae bacterium]|jgi:TonB family protein|nr:TonB family protein [Bryobacteraceae bacterium]
MKVFWQQCEGQVIDGFPLRQYLGGGEDQAVFLTEYGGEVPRKAAIKLTHADPESTEDQLRRWRLAAELSHPNLMRLFERGAWHLDKVPLLYVVMEYADEDLSQVIPERPLTVEEAKEVLEPALSALEYLHSSGFVHGHLKPSNFLAIDGRLKISSDGVSQIGAGSLTPADDVWSLGMMLVEVLTQRLPVWSVRDSLDPVLPETMPAFYEIARNTLRRDPKSRWTVAQIQQRLSGKPIGTRKRFSASMVTTALLGAMLAIAAGTLLIRNRETAPAAPAQSPAVQNQPAPPAKQPAAPATRSTAPATMAAAPAVPTPRDPAPVAESKPSPVRPAHGEIVHQVLPEVLPRARSTIHGKVAASIRVEVDASGDVTDATLESAGPSQYFSGLALKAARQWKFAPADAPRVWTLKFEFTRTGTKVATAKSG